MRILVPADALGQHWHHAWTEDDLPVARQPQDLLVQHQGALVRGAGDGLAGEFHRWQEPGLILGVVCDRVVAETLFEFLGQFYVACAEHDLGANIVEDVDRQLGAV